MRELSNGVVDRQVGDFDTGSVTGLGVRLGEPAAHSARSMYVGGVGDDVMLPPAADVLRGGFTGRACHGDFIKCGAHDHQPVDKCRVHAVLVGVDGDVVVARQPRCRPDTEYRRVRRQGTHCGLVGGEQVRRLGFQRGVVALVSYSGKPLVKLGLHIDRIAETTPGKKRTFHIAVRALHDALGFLDPSAGSG